MSDPSVDDIKKLERKAYLFCLAGLVAGGLLLALVWKTTGLLAGILGGIGILLMLAALIMLGFFFDLFYKLKGQIRSDRTVEPYRETYVRWPAWFTKWGRNVLLFMLGAGLMTLGSMHENDFGGNRFVWHALVAGFVAGLIIYNILKLQRPTWNDNRNMSLEIGFYIIVSSIYVCVVLGPLVNNQLAVAPPVCKEYIVLSKSSKYFHINNNGKKERFKPRASFLKKVEEGKPVTLCVRKGYLGYEYVDRFIAGTGQGNLK